MTPWPYPLWIAHRGAGKLAPENTLAAFRLGASHGYRMFECDAKLSADGVVFLLHDDTLERTSNGKGLGGDHGWADLSQLDAGAWHSRAFAGEPLATLTSVARFCQANSYHLNIEIKPTPGQEASTGRAVALLAQQLWHASPADAQPFLTSFQPAALQAAKDAVPALRRGLLLESLWDGWLGAAQQLACEAVICDHPLWTAETMGRVRQTGLRTLAYTVNDRPSVERLKALGIDGLITDKVDLFSPAA